MSQCPLGPRPCSLSHARFQRGRSCVACFKFTYDTLLVETLLRFLPALTSSYRNSPAKLALVVVSRYGPSDFGSLISTCSSESSTQVLLFLLGDRFLKVDTWRRRSFTAIPAHSPAWASVFSTCCIMTRSKATYPS